VDSISIDQEWFTYVTTAWERLGCMPVEHHQGLDYAEFLAVAMFGVGEMVSGFSSVVNVGL
jgi:hypothetical protein